MLVCSKIDEAFLNDVSWFDVRGANFEFLFDVVNRGVLVYRELRMNFIPTFPLWRWNHTCYPRFLDYCQWNDLELYIREVTVH